MRQPPVPPEAVGVAVLTLQDIAVRHRPPSGQPCKRLVADFSRGRWLAVLVAMAVDHRSPVTSRKLVSQLSAVGAPSREL
jgi:hypothetical protein